MEILFVLGNGFDLQLGLPTSYGDFYRYYQGVPTKSEAVKKLKTNISDDKKNWSDLEIALGNYTSCCESIDEFCEAYDDIQRELQNYLLEVDKLISSDAFDINANSNTIISGIVDPQRAFSPDIARAISHQWNEIKEGQNSSDVRVNIVTFNYTHTIEHFIERLESPRGRFVNRIIHLHREILPNYSIWLGVDNSVQIANTQFQDKEEVKYRLVKPLILENSGGYDHVNCTSSIETSDAICIFGASLGDSDLTWAKRIFKRVVSGVPTLLFLKDNEQYLSDNQKLIAKSNHNRLLRDRFEQLGLTSDESSMNLQIAINSDIFTDSAPNNHDANLNILLNKLGVTPKSE